MELPYYSKFLLIAAYLASYNPAKSDKKFFSKVLNSTMQLHYNQKLYGDTLTLSERPLVTPLIQIEPAT